MADRPSRFLDSRDYWITPLIEGALLGAGALLTSLLRPAFPGAGWIELGLLFYACVVLLTLFVLKFLRTFYPLREGIHSGGKSVTFYVWRLYGFLCLMNLHPVQTPGLLPDPVRALLLRAMGMKIGKGAVIGGVISDPHLTTVGDHAIIGAGSTLSAHAIIRTGPGFALVIGRIQVAGHALISTGAILSPGARVMDGAMVNPNSVVPMNACIGADELWSGAPAAKVRKLC